MGISGLLPVLKSCSRPVHVREYRGCKVVVDGYSWLHKGAYTCARELCEGIYTDRFVQFCLSRVELLRQNGLLVTVVLDGGRLPMKAEEEDTRKKTRRENLEKARTHLLAGNVSAAEDCYQKAVGISSSMAKQLIEALKDVGVPFIVAPYEADAQMCYLSLIGEAHAVITEDSDLLAYGCERVLYKLDRNGHGEEICLADLPRNKGLSFVGFSHNMFLEMCIMAGCDFLPNLPGIGIKKAHGHLKKLRSFLKVVKSLRFSGVPVPRDYEIRFQMVLWVFRHQRVYCPRRRECVHVRPLPPGGLGAADVDVPAAVPRRKHGHSAGNARPDGGSNSSGPCATAKGQCAGGSGNLAEQGQQEDGTTDAAVSDQEQEEDLLSFLGPMMPPDVAKGVAQGDLQPSSKQPYDLAQIYQGCPVQRMPRGVQRLLFPTPTTDTTTHALQRQPQQHHHQWRAHAHRPQKQAAHQEGRHGQPPLHHGKQHTGEPLQKDVPVAHGPRGALGGLPSTHTKPSHALSQQATKQGVGLGSAKGGTQGREGASKQGGAGAGKAGGKLPQLLAAMTQHQVQHQQQLLQQQQAERLRQSSARAITAPFVRPSRSRPADASGAAASGAAGAGSAGSGGGGGTDNAAKDRSSADEAAAAASGQARASSNSSSGCSPGKSKPAAPQEGHVPFRVLVATSAQAAATTKHSTGMAHASRGAAVNAAAPAAGTGVRGGARVSGLSKAKLSQGRQRQQPHQQQKQQQQLLLPLRVLSGPSACVPPSKEMGKPGKAGPVHHGGQPSAAGVKAGDPPLKRQRTEPSPLRQLLQQQQQEPQPPAAQQHVLPAARLQLSQQQQQLQQEQHTSLAAPPQPQRPPPPQQQQQQQEQEQHPGPPMPRIVAHAVFHQSVEIGGAHSIAHQQQGGRRPKRVLDADPIPASPLPGSRGCSQGEQPTAPGHPKIDAPDGAPVAAASISTDASAQSPGNKSGPDSNTAAAAAAAAAGVALDRSTAPAPARRSPPSRFPSISDDDLDDPQLQAMLQDSQEQVISETTEEADLEAPAPLQHAQQPLPHHPTHHQHQHHHKHRQHQGHHHGQHRQQCEHHAKHHDDHHHKHQRYEAQHHGLHQHQCEQEQKQQVGLIVPAQHKQQGAQAASCTALRAPLRDISNTAGEERSACAAEHAVPAAAAVGAAKRQQQICSKPRPALSALGFRPSGTSSSHMEGMGGSQLSQQTSSIELCGFAAQAATALPPTHHRPSITSSHCQHEPFLHPIYQHHQNTHQHHQQHRHDVGQQRPEYLQQDIGEGGIEHGVILPEDAVEDPLPVGVDLTGGGDGSSSDGWEVEGARGGDEDEGEGEGVAAEGAAAGSPALRGQMGKLVGVGASGQLSDSSVESWEGVGRGTAARMRALLRGRQLGESEVQAGWVTSEEEGEGACAANEQGPPQQQQGQQEQEDVMPSSKRRRVLGVRSVPLAQELFGPFAAHRHPTEPQQQQQQGRQLFGSFAMQLHPEDQQQQNQQQQHQQQQQDIGQEREGGDADGSAERGIGGDGGREQGPEHAAIGSSSSGSFHSVGYVKQYGEVAVRAIDHVMGEVGAGAEERGAPAPPAVVTPPVAVVNGMAGGSEQEGVAGQQPCAFVDGGMQGQQAGPAQEGAGTPSESAQVSEGEGACVEGLQDACPNEELLLGCTPMQHQHRHSMAQHRHPPHSCTLDALLQRQAHPGQQHGSNKQQLKCTPVHVPYNPFSGLIHTPPSLLQHQHPGSKLLSPTVPGSKSTRKPSTGVTRALETKKGGGAKAKAKGAGGPAPFPQHEAGPSVFVAHAWHKTSSRDGKAGLFGGQGAGLGQANADGARLGQANVDGARLGQANVDGARLRLPFKVPSMYQGTGDSKRVRGEGLLERFRMSK